MPKTIYYSRAITWNLQNPRVHVSRVHKRVSKLVNFKVQKVQKPDLFYLMNNFPRSPALMTIFCHQQNPSAFHFIYLFTLAPCGRRIYSQVQITRQSTYGLRLYYSDCSPFAWVLFDLERWRFTDLDKFDGQTLALLELLSEPKRFVYLIFEVPANASLWASTVNRSYCEWIFWSLLELIAFRLFRYF